MGVAYSVITKKLAQANSLGLSGRQPPILLTLVLFPRVEVAATVKNDGFWASEFRLLTIFTGFQIQSSPAISREQIENQPNSFGVKRALDICSP